MLKPAIFFVLIVMTSFMIPISKNGTLSRPCRRKKSSQNSRVHFYFVSVYFYVLTMSIVSHKSREAYRRWTPSEKENSALNEADPIPCQGPKKIISLFRV